MNLIFEITSSKLEGSGDKPNIFQWSNFCLTACPWLVTCNVLIYISILHIILEDPIGNLAKYVFYIY